MSANVARGDGAGLTTRVAFFDCYSGASGNMILGALVDAGANLDRIRADVARLPISGYEIEPERVVRGGLVGTQLHVAVTRDDTSHRGLSTIEAIIYGSDLPQTVRERSMQVFRRLAETEAGVHGIEVDAVQFHEIGAVDAIVDVVGSVVALDDLGVEAIHVADLPLGSGSVRSDHGLLPLPAPATLALLAAAQAPTRPVVTDAELVTPTGAAILTTLGHFGQPSMRIEGVGVGFGSRELPWPNILRVWLGSADAATNQQDEVVVIETNLDDCTPEEAGYALERLFEEGALDVFFTSVQMKKNRPGILLTALARQDQADRLATTMLRETTTLGVRMRAERRLICARRTERIDTELGSMTVKIKVLDGREIVCPEYEECARIARARGVALRDVYAAALRAQPRPAAERA